MVISLQSLTPHFHVIHFNARPHIATLPLLNLTKTTSAAPERAVGPGGAIACRLLAQQARKQDSHGGLETWQRTAQDGQVEFDGGPKGRADVIECEVVGVGHEVDGAETDD